MHVEYGMRYHKEQKGYEPTRVRNLFALSVPNRSNPSDTAISRGAEDDRSHIHKVRFERGLLQKEVADLVGVNVATIVNWEKNHTQPPVMLLPKIIDFLGYDPVDEIIDNSLGSKIKQYRMQHGLSIKKMAKLIPCDESTISRLEQGKGWFYEETLSKINEFFTANTSQL